MNTIEDLYKDLFQKGKEAYPNILEQIEDFNSANVGNEMFQEYSKLLSNNHLTSATNQALVGA